MFEGGLSEIYAFFDAEEGFFCAVAVDMWVCSVDGDFLCGGFAVGGGTFGEFLDGGHGVLEELLPEGRGFAHLPFERSGDFV